MLITLIYGSSAVGSPSEHDLQEILEASWKNNKPLGITGMLLYRGGNFLQVLEGEKEVVESLYNKIKTDPRHHSVLTIFKRQIKQREFSDWTMGFVNLETLDPAELPGYSSFLSHSLNPEEFAENPAHAMRFLASFKETMR